MSDQDRKNGRPRKLDEPRTITIRLPGPMWRDVEEVRKSLSTEFVRASQSDAIRYLLKLGADHRKGVLAEVG